MLSSEVNKSSLGGNKQKKYIDVETINAEEYDNIEVLYETYKYMGMTADKNMALKCIPGYLTFYNIVCYKLSNTLYIKKKDAELFKNFVMNFDKEKYFTRNEVAKLLEMRKSCVHNYDGKLYTKYKYGGELYYRKEEIQYFIDLKKQTRTSEEIRDLFNFTTSKSIIFAVNTLKSRGNKNVDIISQEKHPFGLNNLVKGYEDVIKYFQYNYDLKHIEIDYDKFVYKIKDIETHKCKAPETLKELKEFAKERYNVYKQTDVVVNSHVRIYRFLNQNIIKEINKYNEEEFKELYFKFKAKIDFRKIDNNEIVLFIRFCKAKYRGSKLPDMIYQEVRKKSKHEVSIEDEYSTEEWYALAKIIFEATENQDKIKLAIRCRTLSVTWAYIALHFISPWRKEDIQNLPHPNLKLLGFDGGYEFFEYIKNGGSFTKEMGEIICLDVTRKINGVGKTSGKNGQPLRFILSESMFKPIGLLLCLCEAHKETIKKKDANRRQIITRHCEEYKYCYQLFGEKYKALLGEQSFSNTKATNIYLKLLEQEGSKQSPALGLYLPSVMRPHKAQMGDPSSTTADIYLTHSYNNKDNDINNITLATMERGFMASTHYKLLFALNTNFKDAELETQTNLIKSLSLTPTQIHLMSKSIMKKQSEIDEFVKLLIACGRDKIKGILINMLDGNAPSKHHHANCLLRATLYKEDNYISLNEGSTDICEMKQSTTCFGCPFLISEKYFLLEIAEKIKETIDYFNYAVHYRDKKRYGCLLQVLRNIIADAVKILGKGKVKNYITDDILNSLAFVEKKVNNLKEIGVN